MILTWTSDGGGSREVPPGSVLGRGGQYVAYPTIESGMWNIQPVTGRTDGVLVASGGEPVLWQDRVASAAGFLLAVRSSDAGTGTYTRNLGNPCGRDSNGWKLPRLIDRMQRWVLASCDGVPVVHDDAGDVPVPVYRPVRLGLTGFDHARLQVGEGVVVGFADGVLTAAPVLGDASPAILSGSTAFDLDDDGRTVIHVDAEGAVRTTDVGPVASSMLTVSGDTTPPVSQGQDFVSGGVTFAGISPTRAYEVVARGAWEPSTDLIYIASGVASVELRHGPTSDGPWTGVSGTSVTVTYPPGHEECWQTRAADKAGNVSAWTGPDCVRVDGTAPVVSPKTPPSSTKARTSGSTSVTFSYSAKDAVALDTYDVRYRVTPKGRTTAAWVYPSTRQKTTATSITVSAPKSSTACFSVRARDLAGNTSSWTSARCTYLDGTAPRLAGTSITGTYLTPKTSGSIVWWPRYTTSATDDRWVAGYQFQQRRAFGGSAHTTTSEWGSARTRRDGLEPGGQSCWRSRARDGVGNVGAWSGWRCAQAPLTPTLDWNRYVSSSYITEVGRTDVVVVAKNRWQASSDGKYSARVVRVKVRTGPNEGTARVYVGDRYLGTISGKSSRVGWKWVTVSATSPGKGRVKVVPLTSAPTRFSTLYVMRWRP